MSTENIEVIPLGEDGELWFVTGTTDAHSVEEAVRQHVMDECGEPLEDVTYANDIVTLGFEYRTDWGWKHPEGWPPEREPEDDSRLVHGEQDPRMPRFAGFRVTL